MAKSNKQINKEAVIVNDETSPAVVAYRMGQLEQTVKEGFKEHNEKLDKLVVSFATKFEVQELEKRLNTLDNDRKWKSRVVLAAAYSAAFLSLGSLIVAVATRAHS